jgi:hypothetical protein
MNIKLESHPPIETKPFNMECDDWDCVSNIRGYCHGCPARKKRWIEEPVELDVFKVHDRTPAQWKWEDYCPGYQKKGEK